MRTSLILPLAALVALALTACTSHPAPTAAVQALTNAVPRPMASYHEYEVRSQLAEGLALAGGATMDIYTYFGIRGKLPTSIAQTESILRSTPEYSRPGKYVGSVAIGPTPGKVTVLWADGALAGKTLVLLPSLGNRLCFRVDDASTTIPADVLAHANIVDKCNDDE